MQKITPFLWFNDNADAAVNFYVSIFKNSKVLDVSRYGEGGSMPAGTAMIVNFLLDGREYMALNGGPDIMLNEAFSLFVSVETQEEVDDLWNKFTDGGEEVQCGWLRDRFGLSWQIVPTALGKLMGDPDPVKSQRVMQAMLQMKKLDIAGLQRAYEGK
jgi:predicted 3-demethylubiquinone-9 3-methyltransferase (glyoxalase superfamily)